MDHLGKKAEVLTDFTLCFSFLLIAFTLVTLSMIMLVMCFGWFTLCPEELVTGLAYKFNQLLGWPKYLIAYVTFVWALLYLSNKDYTLKRKGSRKKNIAYFTSLYLFTVVLVQLMLKFIYFSILTS